MAKRKDKAPLPKPAEMGSNIQGLQDKIRDAYDRIEQLKKERQAISAEIKSEREKVEAAGITKIAFDAAMSYMNLSPEKREGFDLGYGVCRTSFGAPVRDSQTDLFAANTLKDEDAEDDGDFEAAEDEFHGNE